MPSLTRNIPHQSVLARTLLQEIQRRVRFWENGVSSKAPKWRKAEEKILAYMPEREVDRARSTARENGLPQYTTIQIPYSYAVTMAAYTYLTSVFGARDPIFQFTGRHGESQQQVQALEALIAYQVLVGGMNKKLHTWFYDSLKYGAGIVGCYWDQRFDVVSSISEQQEIDPITQLPLEKPQKVLNRQMQRSYAGNVIYNLSPQQFIWDVRKTLANFQEGEYAGEKKKVGWNEIVRRVKLGYYMEDAVEQIKRGTTSDYSYTPTEGSSVLERPEIVNVQDGFDSSLNSGPKSHPLLVGVYQLVWEIIPNEWNLGNSDYPEKWVFTCTDDFVVLFGAQPLGAWHAKFPYSVIPFEPEGYGITTRGLPEILEPVQNTVDWLINSHFYNVRAALNNKVVVDPSRVVMKDVLDPLPGGVIRLKPEAYGTDTKLAMNQMAIHDVTQSHLTDFQMMIGVGERVGGVNDQIMGMLAPGGRKTATEVRTSTSFGINRLKTTAEFASSCGMDPLAMMLVQNSQQYYDMELKFAIAGDLLMNAGQGFIQVNPAMIAGFYNFVPVDGTLPIDKMAQVSIWKEIFQTAAAVPAIGMQYDLGGIFQWIAQLAGMKNITQFKIQLTPDQVLAAQMQAGNVVPLGGGAKPKGQDTKTAGQPPQNLQPAMGY